MLPLDYRREEMDRIVSELDGHLKEDIPPRDFVPIEPAEGRICAVDGGSAILLDGGSFAVAAARAGHVIMEGGRVTATVVPPVSFRLMEGGDLEPRGDFRDAVTTWRGSLEMEAAAAALESLGPGDVLLLDGHLSSGSDTGRLVAAASARGVHVAGVSKTSRLTLDGPPAVLTAILSAAAHDVDPPWAVPVRSAEGIVTFVAMLHPAATTAFRVDVTDDRVLGMLAASSRDPVYPGYPYPLARAHNDVALHGPLREHLRYALLERCPRLGRLVDFHAVLDRNW